MFTFIKLIVLVTLVEMTLATDVGEPPASALQLPHVGHVAFVAKNHVSPTDNFRYGYEIHDPATGLTARHYEMRYSGVNLGIDHTVGASTVNYTIDATNGYRATFSAASPEHATLDYKQFASPLVSATPPNDVDTEPFKSFSIDDGENIEKHSPTAQSAYKARNNFNEYFSIVPAVQYSWGYEIEGRTSQYETRSADRGEGRITLVSADGCVSTMYYAVDASTFNVSTIRTFGKQDISQLYLSPQLYPLLLQIALGASTCDV